MELDKVVFNNAINYLSALEVKVKEVNKYYDVRENNILYYHVPASELISMQFLRDIKSDVWELNVYFYTDKTYYNVNNVIRYKGKTPEELLNNIEQGVCYA